MSFLFNSLTSRRRRHRRLRRKSKRTAKRGSGGSASENPSVIVITDTSNVLETGNEQDSEHEGYGATQGALDFEGSDLDTPIAVFKNKNKKWKKTVVAQKRIVKSKKVKGLAGGEGAKKVEGTCDGEGTSRQLRMHKRKKATVADAEETLDARRKRKKSRRADFPTLTTRSSPVQFFRCISVLSSEQQLAVKEMGFGRLLHFRMDGVPGKLAHFVIDSFDPDTMEIHAPCGAMKINKTVVRKLLGIPSGGVKLMSTEKKIEMDSAVSNWRKRYSSKLVSAKSMVDSIEKSGGADSFDFRMDFLMCFVTVMIDCHKQGTLREAILYHISSNMKGGFGKGWLKCLSITWDKDDQPSVKDRVQVVETNIDEILKYKKRVEDVLGQLCVEHPEDVDVLTLKARYETLLHDKPMWIRDAEAS